MHELLELRVTNIRWETHNSITIFLVPTAGEEVRYQAGQFLTLIIETNGRSIRRSYSFSSTPNVDKELAITVKQVDNGEVSRWLLKSAKVGMYIKALRPAGLFLLDYVDTKRELIFIAAGSGITPVYSLLKEALYRQPHARCLLIYQNATEADIIFKKQLEDLEFKFGARMQYRLFISRTPDGTYQRRITKDILTELLQKEIPYFNPANRIFICGPKPFMRMADFTVRMLGYLSEQIRMENFVVDYVPAPKFTISTDPRKVTVVLNNRVIEFQLQYPRSVLEAALSNSIELPYSCRGGRCGSCVARCTSGTMYMSINEVLTDKDLAEGLVLPCVGFAATDLKLEYHLQA